MSPRKWPMSRYWSLLFFAVLMIGLLIIGFVASSWLKQNALDDRLRLMDALAVDATEAIAHGNPNAIPQDMTTVPLLTQNGSFVAMKRTPTMYVMDHQGIIRLANDRALIGTYVADDRILQAPIGTAQLKGKDPVFIVKRPIETAYGTIGYVVMLEKKSMLTALDPSRYQQFLIFIIALAVIGFIVISLISRRLTAPIATVVEASRAIERGEYDQYLNTNSVKELELVELMESFNAMSSRLQQLESVRTELLAGVTHELKTPLTSMTSLLQALRDDVVPEEERAEFVVYALEEGEKMKRLVDDLVEFNTFATGRVHVELEVLDVREVMERLAHVYEATYRNVTIELWEAPVLLSVDRLRLEQIIKNLWNNSIRAMSERGTLRVVYEERNEAHRFDFIDEGKGIPIAEQPYIFERFFRGQEKLGSRGFGLGLPLAQMMAHSMNGHLYLVQSDERGTIFRLTFQK